MIKTKATEAGKVGGNHPAPGSLADTTRTRVGGQMPATDALPTMADQFPWLTAAPANIAPPDSGADAQSLPLFSPSAGFTDSGAASSGDVGGAA